MLLLGALSLGACGFAPVYGPQGGAGGLLNAVALPEPTGDAAFAFNRRFEERLGRGTPPTPPYALSLRLETTAQDIGATSAGNITRYRLIGRAFYALSDTATGATLRESRTNAFTGYSTTGSTVATRAAEEDARARLMVLLADQVIDDLLLYADTL